MVVLCGYCGNILRMKVKLELTKRQIADLRTALVHAINAEHPGKKYRTLDYLLQKAIARTEA